MPTNKSTQFVRMMCAAFLCYMAMVMPLSSLTIQVTQEWGLSNLMAGIVAEAAFFITMACRKPAGDLSDRQGGKYCFLRGCFLYAIGSGVCLLGALAVLPIPARYAAVVAGRFVLGVAESLCNVGMAHWAVSILGVAKAGRVFATVGMSMYAAVAVGGQAGFVLYARTGFAGLLVACVLSPLAAFLLVRTCEDGGKSEASATKVSLRQVISRIWRLSLPASFSAVGFPVLGTFLTKTFLDRGWRYAGLGLTFWGIGYVVMRIFIGHLPDKIGGLPVAAWSAVVQMSGLYLLWLAPGPYHALAGSFLTGAGTSMVLPSLCMEIVRSVPAVFRGSAISCYNIFIDVSYAFAGPIAGFFTDRFGDDFSYLFAAAASTVCLAMVLNLRRQRRKADAAT